MQRPWFVIDRRGWLFLWPACLAALLAAFASPALAAPLTPKSPEVVAALQKAVAYLEKSNDGRLGAKALVGLALVKSGHKDDHPKIQDAVKTIHDAIDPGPEKFTHDIYSTGLAIMFLVAVDPDVHLYDIEKLVRSLELRQKPEGAWGYPVGGANGEKCDTSMTQFAVLGLWEAADQAGVEVPVKVWENVSKWLVRTQDPSGAWGYQGVVSKKLGERIKQDSTRHPMAVAGLCSVFICRDRLGLGSVRRKSNDDTPSALKPVETADEAKARVKTRLDPKTLQRARASGAHWLSENFTVTKPNGFIHYYMYALERYQSFREAEDTDNSRGVWYDQGARFLIETQKEDGSWESQAGAVPDTCFGALFLLRSMKKSLERSRYRYGEGILVGGRGVPAVARPRVRRGQVTVPPTEDVQAALAALAVASPGEENEAAVARAFETLADLADGPEQAARDAAEPLRKLARHATPEFRRAAVRALDRAHRLDEAPTLIRALDDSDVEVVLAAREALLRLSRRPASSGPDPNASEKDRKLAIVAWKDWFRSARPSVDLD